MKWEEFKRQGVPLAEFQTYERTEVECPKCGAVIYRRTDIVLTTNPPMSQYECLKCGWTGASW